MISYWFKSLVRDKDVETMRGYGAKVISKTLNFNDFITGLDKKLIEKVGDLSLAKGVEAKTIELIDVLEVLDSYRDTLAISEESLKEKCFERKKELSGFDKREYVEYIEVQEGSYFDIFCKKYPDKYPKR